jgi:two-component system OmpR family sensor kinase
MAEKHPFAVQKHIDLQLRQASRLTLSGDREALRVMISNLIDNAIRYIPEGGKVEVALLRDAAGASVSVTDNGPGIPPEERERVFDRFYRCAGNESAGSGLGLAIVKNVADRHGARLSLSEGDGRVGLRVCVRFADMAEAPGIGAAGNRVSQ